MTILQSVIEYAQERGIIVDAHRLPNLRAVTVQIPGRYVIGYDPDAFDTDEDAAEAIAHELGHILTGTLYAVDAPKNERLAAEGKANSAKIELLEILRRGR